MPKITCTYSRVLWSSLPDLQYSVNPDTGVYSFPPTAQGAVIRIMVRSRTLMRQSRQIRWKGEFKCR